jgi:hypothetical protein
MNKREFVFACIPGLEQDLEGAKKSLSNADELLFQEWAKDFNKLPEPVLRELWRLRR